ncbi:MAG: hypothetical protein M5T61_20990 [Acidimicrobiia bacterium]|nr:hypothetical protein [Acidimicrobiia bacterium]
MLALLERRSRFATSSNEASHSCSRAAANRGWLKSKVTTRRGQATSWLFKASRAYPIWVGYRRPLPPAKGELGAVVDGGIRDVSRSRELGFPVWAREVSPITGKWRIETVEVNGSVEIGGVRVSPGDVVVADSTGVCFIPLDALESVVTRCEEIVDGERQRHADIASGISVPELANRTYVYQYSVDREPEDTATREASKP